MRAEEVLAELNQHTGDVHKLLLSFEPRTLEQIDAIDAAQEALTEWQEVHLHNVRKAFENIPDKASSHYNET